MDEMGATSVQVTPPLPRHIHIQRRVQLVDPQTNTTPTHSLSPSLSLSHSNTVSCAKTTGLVLLNKINYNKDTSNWLHLHLNIRVAGFELAYTLDL